MSDYTKKAKEIISKRTGIEEAEIQNNSFFEDDLNIGELELIEVLEEIEEELEVELIDKREEIETFEDLLDLLSDIVE